MIGTFVAIALVAAAAWYLVGPPADGSPARIALFQAQAAFWQTFATIGAFVAAVGAALFAKQAVEEARRGANAAEDSVYNLERAYLFLQVVNGRGPISYNFGAPSGLTQPRINFSWKNVGRTPALLRWGQYRLMVEKELPPEPVFDEPKKMGSTPIPAGEAPFDETWYLLAGINKEAADEVAAGTKSAFFFGVIEYDDIFRRRHTKGFGIQWMPKFGIWAEAGGDAYNYERSEELVAT